MATTDSKSTKTKTPGLYEKLSLARLDFLKADVKKSGINSASEYDYFELADLTPVGDPILAKHRLLFVVTFPEGVPTGTLYDFDSEATLVFNSESVFGDLLSIKGNKIMTTVQSIGAKETFYRRYLYMQLFNIVEHDPIEELAKKNVITEPVAYEGKTKTSNKPISATERTEIKNELTNNEGKAEPLQIEQLKQALKTLNDLDDDYEEFVTEVVIKTDNFENLTKEACTTLILKVGELIEESQKGIKEG